LFAETAGGVTVAVTRKLIKESLIKPEDLTIIALTGNGLKTPEAVHLAPPTVIDPKLASFERLLETAATA